MERKKPKFIRQEWHKKIKLGSKLKKKRKWRAAKGRHSKIRMGIKGKARKPKIGWSVGKKVEVARVVSFKDLENVKGKEIIIGKVGLRKRQEIIKRAKEKNLKVLNKYKERKKLEKREKKVDKKGDKKDKTKSDGEENATKK